MCRKGVLTAVLVFLIHWAGFSQNTDRVLYTGRFDFSGEAPSFSHVGSSLEVNFTGTGASALFSAEYGSSYLYVILDGRDDPWDRKVIEVSNPEAELFTLAENLPSGFHTLELVKLNPYNSKLSFHGFEVSGGNLLDKPVPAPLSIEFYGDSNPAGHSAWG
jgi:hypothetical protein